MLSFALGIVASLLYITSMKILGKGFFLMMHLIAVGFLLLSMFTTTSGLVIALALIAIVVSFISIYFKYLKTQDISIQQILSTIMFLCICLALFLEVHNTKHIRHETLELLRVFFGGLLLGGSLTAMLLGHWYLVQPGLNRTPVKKMCEATLILLAIVCAGWLFSPSMLQVFSGTIKDGWDGMLANMWAGASVASFIILIMSLKALAEKSYTAVMATTGLLYLAILLIAGVELIPRSIFS